MWRISDAWELVHPLRKKEYDTHTKWCISYKADKRKEMYELIRALPDPRQDKMFLHILRNHSGDSHKGQKGKTKRKILEVLEEKDMTVREISYALDLSASTVRTRLKSLEKNNKISMKGLNKKCPNKNQRTAHIWEII